MTASLQRIGFQGVVGANSNLVAKLFYPKAEYFAFPTFYNAFHAVISKTVDIAIIPLENSFSGRVAEIHGLLQKTDIFIVAEHFFRVRHYLAATKGSDIKKINKVFSHPHALMQCQSRIRELNLQSVEFSNTAAAAQFVAFNNNETQAAICTKEAAKIYDLAIIDENFQDAKDENITIFIAIAREPLKLEKEQDTITSIIFSIKNYAGALYDAIGSFANNNVSIIKLESYIPGGFSTQAKFFISIDGDLRKEKVKKAIENLTNHSDEIKILGSYYADKTRLNIN